MDELAAERILSETQIIDGRRIDCKRFRKIRNPNCELFEKISGIIQYFQIYQSNNYRANMEIEKIYHRIKHKIAEMDDVAEKNPGPGFQDYGLIVDKSVLVNEGMIENRYKLNSNSEPFVPDFSNNFLQQELKAIKRKCHSVIIPNLFDEIPPKSPDSLIPSLQSLCQSFPLPFKPEPKNDETL